MEIGFSSSVQHSTNSAMKEVHHETHLRMKLFFDMLSATTNSLLKELRARCFSHKEVNREKCD